MANQKGRSSKFAYSGQEIPGDLGGGTLEKGLGRGGTTAKYNAIESITLQCSHFLQQGLISVIYRSCNSGGSPGSAWKPATLGRMYTFVVQIGHQRVLSQHFRAKTKAYKSEVWRLHGWPQFKKHSCWASNQVYAPQVSETTHCEKLQWTGEIAPGFYTNL